MKDQITTINQQGMEWFWPEYDTELIKVFDQADDINAILPHVKYDGAVLQAGGACGVWPFRLREHFTKVITFEPDPLNYECLRLNLAGMDIQAYQAALGAQRGWATVQRWHTERTNAGAGYVMPGGEIPVVAIDDLRLSFCDLLLLDVEGSELDVLLGAYLTLERCRPVVVIEEKALPQNQDSDHRQARWFLQRMGYKEAARIHRDVVFTC